MNEAETRAELIDPQLRESGWGVVDGSKILREYHIAPGKILTGGLRGKPTIADYVLTYQGKKLAVLEAKSSDKKVGEGVGQAKEYADRLQVQTTFASNGKEIYQVCMKTGAEGLINTFPTPRNSGKKLQVHTIIGSNDLIKFLLKLLARKHCVIIKKLLLTIH